MRIAIITPDLALTDAEPLVPQAGGKDAQVSGDVV
jgi:hypothetical protein